MQEISAKPYLKALKQYPYNKGDISGSYLYNITSVKAFEISETNVKVIIKTHLFGFLIGKAGKQITEIKELMEHYSDKKVEIEVVEEDMFNMKNIKDYKMNYKKEISTLKLVKNFYKKLLELRLRMPEYKFVTILRKLVDTLSNEVEKAKEN